MMRPSELDLFVTGSEYSEMMRGDQLMHRTQMVERDNGGKFDAQPIGLLKMEQQAELELLEQDSLMVKPHENVQAFEVSKAAKVE